MIFDLSKNNPYDRQKFIDKVNEMLDKGWVVNLSHKTQRRSSAQNNYFHLLLSFFGSQYGVSMEEVKLDLFKRLVNPDIFVRTKINPKGKQVTYLRSSADLDSTEMTTAIERFRNWSVMVAGIYLPSPNEEQFLAYCEKEVENNKEFL